MKKMEDTSTRENGESRDKKKRTAAITVIAAIILVLFLMPEIQKYQFQKSTDANFTSVSNKDLDDSDLERLKIEYDNAEKTLKNNGYDLEANLKKADVLTSMREYDKAIVVYKKMQEINPLDARPARGLGEIYFFQKKYQESGDMYLSAIKIDAKNLDAYLQMARVYRITGKETEDKDTIKKFYEDGIQQLGDNKLRLVEAYADYLQRIGENDKALEQLNAALAAAPEDDKGSIQAKITALQAKMAAPAAGQ